MGAPYCSLRCSHSTEPYTALLCTALATPYPLCIHDCWTMVTPMIQCRPKHIPALPSTPLGQPTPGAAPPQPYRTLQMAPTKLATASVVPVCLGHLRYCCFLSAVTPDLQKPPVVLCAALQGHMSSASCHNLTNRFTCGPSGSACVWASGYNRSPLYGFDCSPILDRPLAKKSKKHTNTRTWAHLCPGPAGEWDSW